MCIRPYLHYSSRSLLCHVVDSVLVSQPIRSLHCVVEMPPPVIILHVSQSCVDPTLWTRLIFNNSVKLNRHCTIVDYIYMKLCICIANHYCEFVKSQCNERIRNLAWWNAAEKTQNIQNNACPEWTYKKVLLYLCSNSVRPGGEELGDAGSVEASLWQAKSCSESSSSSSYHYSIKLMIHNRVLRRDLKTMKEGSYCKTSNKEWLACSWKLNSHHSQGVWWVWGVCIV